MSALGIDIGGGSVKIVSRSGDGRERSATSARYQNATPEMIRAAIEAALSELDDAGGACESLGLCLPGLLDRAGERVEYAANLPGLVGATVVELLPTPLRAIPRRVIPDALATGVGVWLREPVCGRLLVLAMGTGVGGALLEDGRPVTLDGHGCGHIGQLDVSLGDDAPLGPDAGRGSLEAYVGLPALTARFGGQLASALASLPPQDQALRALARAVRVCHAIYTPDHVRLAGGVGAMLAPAMPTLRSLIERDLTLVARERWSLASIDDLHLAARGAAHLSAQPDGV